MSNTLFARIESMLGSTADFLDGVQPIPPKKSEPTMELDVEIAYFTASLHRLAVQCRILERLASLRAMGSDTPSPSLDDPISMALRKIGSSDEGNSSNRVGWTIRPSLTSHKWRLNVISRYHSKDCSKGERLDEWWQKILQDKPSNVECRRLYLIESSIDEEINPNHQAEEMRDLAHRVIVDAAFGVQSRIRRIRPAVRPASQPDLNTSFIPIECAYLFNEDVAPEVYFLNSEGYLTNPEDSESASREFVVPLTLWFSSLNDLPFHSRQSTGRKSFLEDQLKLITFDWLNDNFHHGWQIRRLDATHDSRPEKVLTLPTLTGRCRNDDEPEAWFNHDNFSYWFKKIKPPYPVNPVENESYYKMWAKLCKRTNLMSEHPAFHMIRHADNYM